MGLRDVSPLNNAMDHYVQEVVGGHMCAPTSPNIVLPKCHENPSKYVGTVSKFATFNTQYTHTLTQCSFHSPPFFLMVGTIKQITNRIGLVPCDRQGGGGSTKRISAKELEVIIPIGIPVQMPQAKPDIHSDTTPNHCHVIVNY